MAQLLEAVEALTGAERLLLYLRLPTGVPPHDPLKQPVNPLGSRYVHNVLKLSRLNTLVLSTSAEENHRMLQVKEVGATIVYCMYKINLKLHNQVT